MEVTITIFEIPITREENEIKVHDNLKSQLTQYKVELDDITKIEKLSKELGQYFQNELRSAKYNENKITVKKKIITN